MAEKSIFDQVLENETVLRAMRAKADRMLPRAQREAAQAGAVEFSKALHVEEGVRPGTKAENGMKRPYVRVTADITENMAEADYGAKLTRQQILRRASRA